MVVDRVENPTPEKFVAAAKAAFRDGAVLTVQANCEVEYDGRTSGYLAPGDRILVAKPDGTFLVHQPTGHKPVNWMPGGGTVEARVSDGQPVLLARRTNPSERVETRIHEAYGITRFDATDGATYEESGTEAEMHAYIEENPEVLGDDIRIVEHERESKYGYIDFYAVDDDGTPVVIEVKRIQATLNHFDQLKRYVELYNDTNEDSEALAGTKSASENPNGEVDREAQSASRDDETPKASRTTVRNVRGMLVAPSASDRVKRALRDSGLEFVSLEEFGRDARGSTEKKIDDFL